MGGENVTRKLTAIFYADVAGYSRLTGADEVGTHRQLSAGLDLVSERIQSAGGTVVHYAGDAVLAEFASVVAAVETAVVIQRALADQFADVVEGQRLTFRIGVNLGEVIVDRDEIYGDGVNVAARLESLAKPGGVCVSSTVFEQVRGKVDVGFEDIGPQEVKNIDRPVRCYHVQLDRPDKEGLSETMATILRRPAVAVLPFANISGDPEQEYFADGLTEDIITALAHWRSFPVIARNSTFTYKDKPIEIKQAGRELGARYLLEGSMRKSGQRIRISAQLIDGVSGHHIWAERYDRQLDDIFEVQDEITQSITAIVAPELVKAEVKRSTAKHPEDLDAWDCCLRGMAVIRERTPEATMKARELFRTAIAIQPDYSDAHAGLSLTYHLDILLQDTNDRMATANLAMEAARDAVKFDESSSMAHRALSTAYQWLNRHEEAVREAKISVALNPNDADGLHALGNKSDLAGDPEGISFMEKAQRLNPQDAQLHSHLAFLARAYVNIGAHEDALDRARKAIERQPDYPHAYYILAIVLGMLGRKEEGLAALSKCDEVHPGFVESRKNWRPYTDANSNETLEEGRRKLGLESTKD